MRQRVTATHSGTVLITRKAGLWNSNLGSTTGASKLLDLGIDCIEHGLLLSDVHHGWHAALYESEMLHHPATSSRQRERARPQQRRKRVLGAPLLPCSLVQRLRHFVWAFHATWVQWNTNQRTCLPVLHLQNRLSFGPARRDAVPYRNRRAAPKPAHSWRPPQCSEAPTR